MDPGHLLFRWFWTALWGASQSSSGEGEISGEGVSPAALLEEAEKQEPYPAALEPLPKREEAQTHEYTFEVTEDEEDLAERVRLWVLDVGPNLPLSFHIVGTQFDTVWPEGGYSVYRGESADGITKGVTGAQVLPLLPAQAGFVELVIREPGSYPIVNHVMSFAELGALGILVAE